MPLIVCVTLGLIKRFCWVKCMMLDLRNCLNASRRVRKIPSHGSFLRCLQQPEQGQAKFRIPELSGRLPHGGQPTRVTCYLTQWALAGLCSWGWARGLNPGAPLSSTDIPSVIFTIQAHSSPEGLTSRSALSGAGCSSPGICFLLLSNFGIYSAGRPLGGTGRWIQKLGETVCDSLSVTNLLTWNANSRQWCGIWTDRL